MPRLAPGILPGGVRTFLSEPPANRVAPERRRTGRGITRAVGMFPKNGATIWPQDQVLPRRPEAAVGPKDQFLPLGAGLQARFSERYIPDLSEFLPSHRQDVRGATWHG